MLREAPFASLLHEKTSVCLSRIQPILSTMRSERLEQNQPLNPSVYVCGGGMGTALVLYEFLLHHFTALLPSDMSGFLESLPDLKPSSM